MDFNLVKLPLKVMDYVKVANNNSKFVVKNSNIFIVASSTMLASLVSPSS